jgi:DNA repair exonuclease SbcCD nuclease subunit
MRLLHLSDTHLGQHLPAWGATPGWHRSRDMDLAFRAALEPALRGEVDLVVHAGDLFDSRSPPPAVVDAALAILEEVAARVPVLLIPGNHDPPQLARCLGRTVAGLVVADEPQRLRLGDLTVAAVPFVRRPWLWRPLAEHAVAQGVDLLVAHQSVHGAAVPGFVFREGYPPETLGAGDLPEGVPLVLAGHLHPRQHLKLGHSRVVYPGSSERTSFAEARETKGYVLWDLGSVPTFTFVDLPGARPMIWIRDGNADHASLLGTAPGTLVRIAEGPTYEALFHEALSLGGWVVGRHPDQLSHGRQWRRNQLGLFRHSDGHGNGSPAGGGEAA